MNRLSGKTAVVTGASKGIGAGIAKGLAAEGAAVVVNYASSKDGADRVVADIKAKGGKAIAVQGDVAKAAEVKKIFADTKHAFGRLDILVNPLSSGGFVVSAGTQSPGPDVGRHLAETVCSACHQIDANAEGPGPNPRAPNFVDISRMPSMSKLAIKVFLRSPHPSMPNIILSSDEIDSVAAYIHSLNKK
jgi:mono/diheme cytochrome c family protein